MRVAARLARARPAVVAVALAAAGAACNAGDPAVAVRGGNLGAGSLVAPAAGEPDATAGDDGPDPGDAGPAPDAPACGDGGCFGALGTVLASGRHTPAGIAVDSTTVYWLELGANPSVSTQTAADAQLLACAKTGCGGQPTVLASGLPWGMAKVAVHAGTVYWFTTGQVLSCASSGCGGQPTVLWSSPGLQPTDLAVDDSGVYFTDVQAGRVLRCSLDGCAGGPVQLWPSWDGGAGPLYGIATDATSVYFTTPAVGEVLACKKDTSCQDGAVVLGVGGQPVQIASDGNSVYFTDDQGSGLGSLAALPASPDDAGVFARVNLLAGLNNPLALATDGRSVYVAEDGEQGEAGAPPLDVGRVESCAAGGCGGTPTVLAGYLNHPRGIAVDDTHLYWTDFGPTANAVATTEGRVMTRAK